MEGGADPGLDCVLHCFWVGVGMCTLSSRICGNAPQQGASSLQDAFSPLQLGVASLSSLTVQLPFGENLHVIHAHIVSMVV